MARRSGPCMDCGEIMYSDESHADCQQRPTLRDRFAMAALAGTLANTDIDMDYGPGAESAYKQADAMLRARAAKGEDRT